MKQVSLLCLLALALPTLLLANWQWQNPSPQGNGLRDVAFVSPTEGFAVGECGAIIHTADGGASWHSLASPSTALLCRVSAVDAEHVWAVGFGGTILRGGATTPWTVQTDNLGRDLRGVAFVDALHGWVVGDTGTVYRTTDGGLSWTGGDSILIHDGSSDRLLSDDLLGVHFIDTLVGWAVGGYSYSQRAVVLKTIDGGQTWVSQNVDASGWLADVTFTDATHGVAVGSGGDAMILQTVDGQHWSERFPADWYSHAFRAVDFSSPQQGCIAGEDGLLFRTTDAGINWSRDTLNTSVRFDGVAIAGDALWAVGMGGAMFHTPGASNAWERYDHGNGYTLGSIAFATADIGCAIDYDGHGLRTTDGGASWLSDGADPGYLIYDVCFIDSVTGWKVGDYARFYSTSDGGATWTQRHDGESTFNAVRFADLRHGWAVGNNGAIQHTVDGGGTWNAQFNGEVTFHSALWVADTNRVWIVGGGGVISHTTDGGDTWLPQNSGTTQNLRAIAFASALEGWAVGEFGTMLHTTDGGATWIMQPNVTTTALWSVAFLNSDTGFAAGWDGTLLRTVNGGAIWEVDASPTTNLLLDLATSPTGRVWVCGDNGTILSLRDFETGAAVSDPVILPPSSFILSSHPNPFNPTTTLSFTLPVAGRVTLAVYDLTGRRMRTLTDRVLAAGAHRFLLDAAAWPSGIYFARLSSPASSVTHKLVLLK